MSIIDKFINNLLLGNRLIYLFQSLVNVLGKYSHSSRLYDSFFKKRISKIMSTHSPYLEDRKTTSKFRCKICEIIIHILRIAISKIDMCVCTVHPNTYLLHKPQQFWQNSLNLNIHRFNEPNNKTITRACHGSTF